METYADTRRFTVDYTGVFRMLFIAAWVFAAVFLLAGGALTYGSVYQLDALELTVPRTIDPALKHLIQTIVPLLILAIGVLLLIAAILGRSGSNAGRVFLALAAILMLVLRVQTFIFSWQAISKASPYISFGKPIEVFAFIGSGAVFSLVYPLLCIVAVMAAARSPKP